MKQDWLIDLKQDFFKSKLAKIRSLLRMCTGDLCTVAYVWPYICYFRHHCEDCSMWALIDFWRFNLISSFHLSVSTFEQLPNLGTLTLGRDESLTNGERELMGKCFPFLPSNKWYIRLKSSFPWWQSARLFHDCL